MEPDDDLSRRPESPKKKIRADISLDSEAQASECSCSNSNAHRNDENDYAGVNGVAPTRKYIKASIPDSSSERSTTPGPGQPSASQIASETTQECEVSSSENTIPPPRQKSQDVLGNADSNCKENEDMFSVCDSASADPHNIP